MPPQEIQGAILAGGEGSRMGPFGSDLPKPLAPVCNTPLVEYQLRAMHDLGITNLVILIGHLGDAIQLAIGDGSRFGLAIRYATQKKRTGLAQAVGLLEPFLDAPFVLMLGDIFFDSPNLQNIRDQFETGSPAAVLAVKHENDIEAIKRNFSVQTDADGNVTQVVEKPVQTPETLKGCGIYLFGPRIFDAIRTTPRSPLRNEFELTDSIQILIDAGHTVRAAQVIDWDINLTYVNDLIECNVHQLHRLNKTSLLGTGCELDPAIELVDTVLGDRVTISGPARLERCVVLTDTTLDASHGRREWSDAVITPSAVLEHSPGT